MNYHSLFSSISLTLLLQTSSVFLLSSCSDQKPLQQNSSPTSSQAEEQENLTGIAKTIQDKAKQFTVRIDYPDGNGSGIIMAKNGETYYVLTAKHVVEQQEEYQIVTPDDKKHQVEPNNIKTLKGADLAVLQFQSGEMYQLATLAEYKREDEEDMESDQKMQDEMMDESNKQMADFNKQMIDMAQGASTNSSEERKKQLSKIEKQLLEHQKVAAENLKKSQATAKKSKEPQYSSPWLFLFGWQRFNNTPQSRLTAGKDLTARLASPMGMSKQVKFVSQSFDSEARSQSYQLSYTNYSQGGMSGGPVLDTLGRVVGIHAAAEGERVGLEEIQLGLSFGIPTKTVLSSISQAGIKPEWLKVEKVRPQEITKADEQSITQNLLEIEPPGNDDTEADWLNYGNDLWRIKRYQEATAAFDEAIKIKPDFYQAYFGKGLVVQGQGLERILQEDSFAEDIAASVPLLDSSSEKELSPEASSEGITQEFDAQMQEVDQGFKKSAENVTSGTQRSAKALPFFKKATEINPDFYPAWRQIGQIKLLEMSAKEMSDLSAASSNSNPPLSPSPKATMIAQEALAAFNKATALNPSDSGLYELKAEVLQKLSRHQEAIEAYSEAIKIDPTAFSYYGRSVSYCQLGDKQKAEADMNSAEKLGYQNAAKDLPVCDG
jgi:tetratricopeptide (TPR) repeat protein